MVQSNRSSCLGGCQAIGRRGAKPSFERRLTAFRALCYCAHLPLRGVAFPVHARHPSPARACFFVITGFNTDIPHEGITYHVQTEDKGVDTPLILSLVYVGGAIIASKRTT